MENNLINKTHIRVSCSKIFKLSSKLFTFNDVHFHFYLVVEKIVTFCDSKKQNVSGCSRNLELLEGGIHGDIEEKTVQLDFDQEI